MITERDAAMLHNVPQCFTDTVCTAQADQSTGGGQVYEQHEDDRT